MDDLEPTSNLNSVTIEHRLGEFTYNRTGEFHLKGHSYDPQVADYIPLFEPLKTKSGATAKRQPKKPRGQPALWWKAQCAFRGLESKGTLADHQNTLRGHGNDPIFNEILQLEKQAKEILRTSDLAEKDHFWAHKWSDEEKSHKDPERFLREKFKPGKASKEIIQLKADSTIWLHQVAKELGLECQTTSEPKDPKSLWPTSSYLAIIGQDKAAVEKRVEIVKKEAARIDAKIQKEKAREDKKARDLKRQEAKYKEAPLAQCKDWDVTGTWEISCPYIMEQWGDENDGLSMEIYQKTTSKGSQMFAVFNFSVLEGVMRFERQSSEKTKATPKSKVNSKPSLGKKRPREGSNEDEGNDDDGEEENEENGEEGEGRRSPTPEAFYLGPTKQPSAKHQKWNYRYRAKETGEGEIQLNEDENLYLVTFGDKGRTLKGNIGASSFEQCEFTGVKVAPGGKDDIDAGELWAEHNESAYNHASSARW